MEPNTTRQVAPEMQSPIPQPITQPANGDAIKTKSRISKWIIVSIIIFILIILGGVYLYFLNKNTFLKTQKNQESITRPTPTPKTTLIEMPTLTASEDASWKTYNNINYKFNIKYPSNITYIDDGKNVEFYIATPSALNQIGQLVGQRLSIYWRGNEGTPTKAATSELSNQSQTNVSFNNVYGVKMLNRFDYYLTSNSGKEPVFRLLFHDDLLQTTYKEDVNQLQEIFNKMLSTFKFTN